MRTGEVNEFRFLAIIGQNADVSFDRHAWVVTNPLFKTGETIEQGALAGIGVADNSNTGLCGPSYRDLIGRYSYFGGFSHQLLRVRPERTWRPPAAARCRSQIDEIQ